VTIHHFGADPDRPLSAAVRAGDWLYVSGQASTDPVSGEFLPGTFDDEFERAAANLLRTLGESGASYEQVVKISGFVRDEQDLPRYNELYRAHFPHPRPARTTLAMGFQFLRVELEAIAYLGT
jgi:2-iminobutanoate/2-iminopropanoate deaminase